MQIAGKLLITGGAGYLATNIVRLLSNTDCDIVRLDRHGAPFPSASRAHFENIIGDIREPKQSLEQGLCGAGVVMHLAAQTSVPKANADPVADLAINVLPMLHLLELCREKQYRPIILFSGTVTESGIPISLPVDETHPDLPITVYDLHKLMAENYLKYYVREGIVSGAVLRLANVYGPGPRSSSSDRGVLNAMIRKALNGERLTIYGAGNFLRDYLYVEDVANAFIKAAVAVDQVNGRHFVIGSGQGHTIAEAVNLIAARVALKTGRRVEVAHVEAPGGILPIEARNFVADTTAFRQATDWQAETSLVDGIDRTIDAFMEEAQPIPS